MANPRRHDPNPPPGHPAPPAPQTGEELDIYPAGAADVHHHHGHTIVSPITLVAVLTALLILTLVTVGASQAESIVSDAFNLVIPQWVNVFVALSIAAIKTTLVVLFFMQLKYDNPLNTIIFLFTLGTVGFFLGFTLTDMGSRDSIYRYKAQYITVGGTGDFPTPRGRVPTNTPIAEWARTTAEAAKYGQPGDKAAHERKIHAPDPLTTARKEGFPMGQRTWQGSSPEQSRPVRGLTLPGFVPEKSDPALPTDDPGDPIERRREPGTPRHGEPAQDAPVTGGN